MNTLVLLLGTAGLAVAQYGSRGYGNGYGSNGYGNGYGNGGGNNGYGNNGYGNNGYGNNGYGNNGYGNNGYGNGNNGYGNNGYGNNGVSGGSSNGVGSSCYQNSCAENLVCGSNYKCFDPRTPCTQSSQCFSGEVCKNGFCAFDSSSTSNGNGNNGNGNNGNDNDSPQPVLPRKGALGERCPPAGCAEGLSCPGGVCVDARSSSILESASPSSTTPSSTSPLSTPSTPPVTMPSPNPSAECSSDVDCIGGTKGKCFDGECYFKPDRKSSSMPLMSAPSSASGPSSSAGQSSVPAPSPNSGPSSIPAPTSTSGPLSSSAPSATSTQSSASPTTPVVSPSPLSEECTNDKDCTDGPSACVRGLCYYRQAAKSPVNPSNGTKPVKMKKRHNKKRGSRFM